ncbi:MAG: hypothetical protein J6P43_02265 [Succinivibrionaceae bacterium]|nr:hypothetical protein [Succinivibrionaceae bacterium]
MDPSIHIDPDNNQVLQAAQIALFKKQSNQEAAQALTLLDAPVQQAEALTNANMSISAEAPRELPLNSTFDIEV